MTNIQIGDLLYLDVVQKNRDNEIEYYYALGETCWRNCIPYEGNEHLSGTTDDCDDFYKNWEE